MVTAQTFEDLEALLASVEILQEEVDEELENTGLGQKLAKLTDLKKNITGLTTALAESTEAWEKDPINKVGDIHWEGTIGITRKPRANRKIDTQKFMDKFGPLLAAQLARINVGDAEQQVSKQELSDVCDVIITYTYNTTRRNKPKFTSASATTEAEKKEEKVIA